LNGKAFKVLRHILAQAALKQTNGNSSAASEILGVAHTVAKKWAEEEV
jgi:DNA-binding protein Fis